MCLQLREGLFDGIEVWAVGRQVQEPAFMLAQSLCGLDILMGGEVVTDHDSARHMNPLRLIAEKQIRQATSMPPDSEERALPSQAAQSFV